MDLRLHMLEASGSLEPWKVRMAIEAEAVAGRIDALVAQEDRRHAVDVLIRRNRMLTIPELGLGGACYETSALTIAVAPEAPNFRHSFEAGAFGMVLSHELHHALRHGACGYGATLGEALVSEGLADRFATEVTGCRPPIWATSAEPTGDVVERAMDALNRIDYDHAAWFFGRGDLPRWVGYALGWRIVDAYLDRNHEESAASLVAVPAAVILDGARSALVPD